MSLIHNIYTSTISLPEILLKNLEAELTRTRFKNLEPFSNS